MNTPTKPCRNGPECEWFKTGSCWFSHENQKTREEQIIEDDNKSLKKMAACEMEGEEYDKFCNLVDRGCSENVLALMFHIASNRKERTRNENSDSH